MEKLFTPVVGAKPSYLSNEDWATLLKTAPHCARYLRGDCKQPCFANDSGEYRVDIDHIKPRSCGGDDSISNLQFLCSEYNRWEKRADTDAHYGRQFWFDSNVDTTRLRRSQIQGAWNVVTTQYPDFFERPTAKALGSFFLLAWMVGAGKTVGILTLMLAINRVINSRGPGRRRITKALILVHQRTLVESLAQEIESEMVKFGIVAASPRVFQIKTGSDWDRVSTGNYDIAVACTQSIWEGDKRILNREALAKKLSMFEAIVVDECQFAPERFLELIDMAPRAWKFSMSATPMDGNGKFLAQDHHGRFVLLSSYSYKDGSEDKILKDVLSYKDGIDSGVYHIGEAGDSEEVVGGEQRRGDKNTTNKNNFIRDNAILIKAQEDVEAECVDYDGHIMVKTESISAASMWDKHWNTLIARDYDKARRGWSSTAVYSNSKGERLSSAKHKWMSVKLNKKKGRIIGKDRSSRVVFVVDIGQFGINNPYCVAIVWLCSAVSLVEIIQRIGRAMRGRGKVRLYWNGKHAGMSERIEAAIDYILNMEERLEEGGFITIDEFINMQQPEYKKAATPTLLSRHDKNIIDELIGRKIIDMGEPITRKAINESVDGWRQIGHSVTEERFQAAGEYASKIALDRDFRREAFGIKKGGLVSKPITVYEEPPEDYPDSVLIKAIADGKIVTALTVDEAIRKLTTDNDWRRQFVAQNREHEKRYFAKPAVVKDYGWDRSKKDLAGKIISERRISDKEIKQSVFKAVNMATKAYFALKSSSVASVEPHEAEYVDALHKISTEKDIRTLVIGMLYQWHPEMAVGQATLYRAEAAEVAAFIGGGEDEAAAA